MNLSEAHEVQVNSSEPSAPAEGAAAPPTPGTDAAELEALRREVEQLRERNLRLLADMRNLQQRAERERADSQQYAEAQLVRELLVVLDDLERARQCAAAAENLETVAEGVRIVHEHFLKVLRSRRIEPIQALGQPFDPHYHEALLHQPSDTYPAGTVSQELARGYTMHQRVLRPARVVVSSGPPPAAQPGGAETSACETREN
jgi:molecular chaperone GrpE